MFSTAWNTSIVVSPRWVSVDYVIFVSSVKDIDFDMYHLILFVIILYNDAKKKLTGRLYFSDLPANFI